MYGGGLMLLIGGFAAYQGSSYRFGTLTRIGPGMLPVGLGLLLMALGTAIVVTARVQEAPATVAPPQWRGWSCIAASLVAFVVLGRYGGLLPASAAVVLIAALGDRDNTLGAALALAAVLVAVTVVVFWWGLRLQLPLLQWG